MKLLGSGTASGQDAGLLVSTLKKLDLFATLSDDQLKKILYFIKTVEFEASETIFNKGDPGDSFYIVQSGKVEARVSGFLGTSKVIRAMGPGDFFGELALILKQPRSASIICVEKTTCFVLDRGDLEQIMGSNPDIASAIKEIARERFDNYS